MVWTQHYHYHHPCLTSIGDVGITFTRIATSKDVAVHFQRYFKAADTSPP